MATREFAIHVSRLGMLEIQPLFGLTITASCAKWQGSLLIHADAHAEVSILRVAIEIAGLTPPV